MDAGQRLTWLIIMGRLQGESYCPQPDRGNPAVRDETGGRRKLTEARNEAPECSDKEPETATPRCPPMQRLRSIPTSNRPLPASQPQQASHQSPRHESHQAD